MVPISGQDLSCHDKVVKVACKNHDSSGSAGSPINFVSAAGLVTVPKDLISDDEVTRIILLVD